MIDISSIEPLEDGKCYAVMIDRTLSVMQVERVTTFLEAQTKGRGITFVLLDSGMRLGEGQDDGCD
jgi:hypothetical protein